MLVLSKNYNTKDFEKSNEATRLNINNTIAEFHIMNIKALVDNILEPCCIKFGFKIPISSGYRSLLLNTKIGGASNSEHCSGNAADLDLDMINSKYTNKDLFNYIKDNLKFRQLIWEFGDGDNPNWVHVSFNPKDNKKEILKASKNEKGKTIYVKYNG
jgi:hypothetical protein